MTQSPASLFITILELIMLNHIPDYAMKKELFLDLYRGLYIHNPSLNFPTLPEGYFASLPSTRLDDPTIHMLLNKKQMNLSPLEGIPKDIAVTIVNSLTNRKAGAKSVYVASVPVDYCAYGSLGSIIVECNSNSSSLLSEKSQHMSCVHLLRNDKSIVISMDITNKLSRICNPQSSNNSGSYFQNQINTEY